MKRRDVDGAKEATEIERWRVALQHPSLFDEHVLFRRHDGARCRTAGAAKELLAGPS